MSKTVIPCLFLCLLLVLIPMEADAKKLHVMEAANQGLTINKSDLSKARREFRNAVKQGEVPAGWKRVRGRSIASLVSGKSVRSYYFHSHNVFDYAFFRSGEAKRRRTSDGAGGLAKWRVQSDQLIAFNLRYNVYTDGQYVILTRQRGSRTYGQIFRKGRKISYGPMDSYK